MRCLLTVLTILTSLSSIPAVPVAGPLSFPFRLKTELCLGASYLADLWLTSYHTGAGQSDLVLSRNRTAAPKWVITTDGALQRERGGGGGQNFDWSAQLAPSTGYAGWEPVTLHAGAKGSQGFAFEGDGQAPAVLTYSTTPGSDKATNGTEASGNQFYSWFVCDWSHGVPQLFWRVKGSTVSPRVPPIPCCAEVKLQISYELDMKISVKDEGTESDAST